MKHRQGFVSNSSSSSFIVGFDKVPETVEEMHSCLFPGGDTTVQPYDSSMTSREVAEQVFSDLEPSKGVNALIEMFKDTYYDRAIYEETSALESKFLAEGLSYHEAWKKADDITKPKIVNVFNKFFEKHVGLKFHVFEYCDNDSVQGGILEHGGIFNNLPHMQISQH